MENKFVQRKDITKYSLYRKWQDWQLRGRERERTRGTQPTERRRTQRLRPFGCGNKVLCFGFYIIPILTGSRKEREREREAGTSRKA